ncbi:MAG: hypothetical protein J7K46_11880 [Bacteroidales bacterium]|nr:hypothetical protein [Bacteroidales bacterium]
MKFRVNKWILLGLLILIPLAAPAQKTKRSLFGKKNTVATAGPVTMKGKKQKQGEKVKERQKKAYEKARKKEIKRRFKMQTKETQARMKQTKKEANQFNKRNKDPFFSKFFSGTGKKKKHKKPKKK